MGSKLVFLSWTDALVIADGSCDQTSRPGCVQRVSNLISNTDRSLQKYCSGCKTVRQFLYQQPSSIRLHLPTESWVERVFVPKEQKLSNNGLKVSCRSRSLYFAPAVVAGFSFKDSKIARDRFRTSLLSQATLSFASLAPKILHGIFHK